MTDSFGLNNLNFMNPERVLWSTDYPHISADFPYSWRTIQSSMSGVPAPTKAAILLRQCREALWLPDRRRGQGRQPPGARRCLRH
jgi:hypothetical protein